MEWTEEKIEKLWRKLREGHQNHKGNTRQWHEYLFSLGIEIGGPGRFQTTIENHLLIKDPALHGIRLVVPLETAEKILSFWV